MTAQQELPTNLEEQLALEDGQLAIMGITRSLAEAQSRVARATHSLSFTRSYSPSHPGQAPHPEAGGMDHEDWNVARLEYEQYDSDDEIEKVAEALEQEEFVIDGLYDDKKRAEAGDVEVVSKYATAERKRIEAEIEKKRLQQESADRWAKHVEGTEIDGSTDLREKVKGLIENPDITEVRGEKSSSGWIFLGKPQHGGGRMFERRLPIDPTEPEDASYASERLTISGSDDEVELQFSEVTDVNHDEVKRYGKSIARADFYSFIIRSNGKVGVQTHHNGPVDTWLPHFMDNGRIKPNINNGPYAPNYNDTELSVEDIAKMQGKINEVTEAMKELAERK